MERFGSRRRELAQAMANHVFDDRNRNPLAAVVHFNRLADPFGEDHGTTRSPNGIGENLERIGEGTLPQGARHSVDRRNSRRGRQSRQSLRGEEETTSKSGGSGSASCTCARQTNGVISCSDHCKPALCCAGHTAKFFFFSTRCTKPQG